MRRTVLLAIVAASVLVPTTRVAAESADDKAIAQQIGAGLKQSGQLHDYRIGVKYQNGVAYLSGTVVNSQQAATAKRLAQGMNGVEHVVNNLSVDGGAAAAGGNGGPQDLGSSLRMASQQAPRPTRPMINQAMMNQASMSQNAMPAPPARMAAAPMQRTRPTNMARRNNMPRPMQQGMHPQGMPVRQAMAQQQYAMQAGCSNCGPGGPGMGGPDMGGMSSSSGMGPGPGQMPMGNVPTGGVRAASYDNASMPGYAWPSYASYPNYAAVTYPQQYSPSAWPYIGPFYPYPQVPLGWRKVALEWDDGWWFLDFSDCGSNH